MYSLSVIAFTSGGNIQGQVFISCHGINFDIRPKTVEVFSFFLCVENVNLICTT